MKPSTETLTGSIERYDERRGGFMVFVPYTDWITLTRRGYSKCLVKLKDELSDLNDSLRIKSVYRLIKY